MNWFTRREYGRLRAKGWRACDAYRAANIRERFADLDGDLVKLEVEPEIDVYDDSYLDENDFRPSERKRYRKELHERIHREGVWILVGYWRPTHDSEWEPVDSVGGFVGDDYVDSGYDDDVRKAALDALQKHEEREAERFAEAVSEAFTPW